MKKITLSLLSLTFIVSMSQAQTTFEVGADKTYTTIGAAWTAAKADQATEIIINVAEGTYTEAEMNGAAVAPSTMTIANKRVTIIGAGADKTIVTRSGTLTSYDLTTVGATVQAGRLFQLNNAVAAGIVLVLEKITFRLIGFTNTNGGAVVNGNQAGQQFTFRNCNFNNIMARSGAIIQAGGGTVIAPLSPDIQVNLENCFIENCSSIDNAGQDGIIKVTSGTLSVLNCNFYNNVGDVINRTDSPVGTLNTDRNLRVGFLIGLSGNLSAATITDCNFINNSSNATDVSLIHPMLSVKPVITVGSVAPGITLGANPSITLSNVISVGNLRTGSVDSDLFYDILMTPPMASSFVANDVKTFDANTTPVTDVAVTSLPNAIINNLVTVNSYFEMDGASPKIVTNSLGVKSLVRKVTGINEYRISELKTWSEAGVLNVKLEMPQNISIYSATGMLISSFKNTNSIQIPLSKGMYLLKSMNNSLKVIVK